jgi:hypothetical protein
VEASGAIIGGIVDVSMEGGGVCGVVVVGDVICSVVGVVGVVVVIGVVVVVSENWTMQSQLAVSPV